MYLSDIDQTSDISTPAISVTVNSSMEDNALANVLKVHTAPKQTEVRWKGTVLPFKSLLTATEGSKISERKRWLILSSRNNNG